MTVHEHACAVSERVATLSGYPMAQAGFLAACVVWWAVGGDMLALTTVLSVVAITLSQMVLSSQRREAAALKAQMAELVKAVPDARDELADADKLTEREITELRT